MIERDYIVANYIDNVSERLDRVVDHLKHTFRKEDDCVLQALMFSHVGPPWQVEVVEHVIIQYSRPRVDRKGEDLSIFSLLSTG